MTAVQARRELRDRVESTALARSFSHVDVSPRMGVTWIAGSSATFHAALSRGIEPPSFDDLVSVAGAYPNLAVRSRELRAQRATTFEIGSRGRAGRIGWNVTAYRARWRDEILRLADANGQPLGASNAGHTLHEGIETAVRWTLSEQPHRVSLSVTSTLGRFRFENDSVYGNNRIAGAPPHVGTAELAYEHERGLFAAIEPTWIAGRTSVDHAGQVSYGGHTLLHVRTGWRRGRHLAIFVTCRNVFDRAHIASTAGVLDIARAPASTAIFLPGVGRGFSIGIEWKHP
jgi:iron complex outermembrane receptor protein